MKETVGRSIGILSNRIRRELNASPLNERFSGAQARTLSFLLVRSEEKDVFQKDIEREYSLRPPTATCLLKEMEKNGLIRREAVPYDARCKRIVATEAALQYREPLRDHMEALEAKLKKGIPEEDMETFFRVISRMIENVT